MGLLTSTYVFWHIVPILTLAHVHTHTHIHTYTNTYIHTPLTGTLLLLHLQMDVFYLCSYVVDLARTFSSVFKWDKREHSCLVTNLPAFEEKL